jgi:pimeloyl-ACP methyl ester carboxylesterase
MTKVFVHGNPEVDALWGPLVDELRARGVDDIVLLSPPGFGAPVPDGWDATLRSYVGWLVGALESVTAESGAVVDIVGHDLGAGFVYGLLAERPGLIRSYAADVAGLIHEDYVWHDAAQAWQTPDVGEQFIDGMVSAPLEDRTALFTGMGVAPEIAGALAAGVDEQMGRCILAFYRDAAQPAVSELGARVFAADRPPGLVINATADAYVSTELGSEVAARLGARELRLEGLGHWWMTEDPGSAADGLVEFWSGL